ncbi:MAG: hypothetical protein ACYS8W_17850 [Planctomycetota bacterium]|jgi:hypothetical protein
MRNPAFYAFFVIALFLIMTLNAACDPNDNKQDKVLNSGNMSVILSEDFEGNSSITRAYRIVGSEKVPMFLDKKDGFWTWSDKTKVRITDEQACGGNKSILCEKRSGDDGSFAITLAGGTRFIVEFDIRISGKPLTGKIKGPGNSRTFTMTDKDFCLKDRTYPFISFAPTGQVFLAHLDTKIKWQQDKWHHVKFSFENIKDDKTYLLNLDIDGSTAKKGIIYAASVIPKLSYSSRNNNTAWFSSDAFPCYFDNIKIFKPK